MFADAAGTEHAAARGAVRIVSLVPSITELVCDLGLADALVGRTGFCVHPREVLRRIPKVGGTKDVDLDRVRALAPTHAIVNVDENRRETAASLAEFVPHVIVTHPLAPLDNLALYRLVGGVFGRRREAAALARRFEAAYARALRAGEAFAREPVLYLIWRNPWMTIARDTYISRSLALAGWDTWPDASPARYPEVALDPETLAQVNVVLLSSEPYRFRARDVSELARRSDLSGKRVALIDGEMTSWYGSRAVLGMRYLPRFRRMVDGASGAKRW